MSSQENEEKVEIIFALLTESGSIEWTGFADDGEPIYRVTEKCKEVFPEFYALHRAELNATAHSLWSMGVIEINFTEDTETVTFTPENYQRLQEVIDELSPDQIGFLETMGAPIKRVF